MSRIQLENVTKKFGSVTALKNVSLDIKDKEFFVLFGPAGAGKTTIGKRLKAHFDEKGIKNYLLDGDEVRDLFDRDLGYSDAEREANIKRILLGAYLLDSNDIAGIVCNIAPLEHLRALARRKIAGYNEIYLKKDLQISMKNDVKGMYAANAGKTQIVGIDARFDPPEHPDLVLEVDSQTEEETFQTVLDYITGKYGAQYGREAENESSNQ